MKDDKQQRFWPNVVRTLGIIGDASACQPMIALLERDVDGELSSPYYRAKTGVLFSLAYVVERDKKATKALNYLIESIDPAVWGKRGLKWKDPYHPENRDRHLSKIAILALGLTGHSGALHALKKPKTDGARAFLDQNQDIVETALKALRIVKNVGLERYYRGQDEPSPSDSASPTRPIPK